VRHGPVCLPGGRQVCRLNVHAATGDRFMETFRQGGDPSRRLAVRGAKVRTAPMQPDTLGQGGT
jgi:hypothetical protein